MAPFFETYTFTLSYLILHPPFFFLPLSLPLPYARLLSSCAHDTQSDIFNFNLDFTLDEARHEAFGEWVVGCGPQDQLRWGLAHGFELVPAHRDWKFGPLLLRHLLWRAARPPRDPRRRHVCGEVRGRLGCVQEARALHLYSRCALLKKLFNEEEIFF